MHIRKIDLNLLPIFDAVMVERSVTAAARRLGMSPSAVSHALARLRELTGDDLFEQNGRGVRPTAQALAMARCIHDGIAQLQSAFGLQPPPFDPATTARTFVVDVPAGSQTLLVPALVGRIVAAGPGLRIRIASERAFAVLNELRFGEIELALDYEDPDQAGLRSEVAGMLEFVVLARSDHGVLAGTGLTRELYERLGHVGLSWTRTLSASPLAGQLARYGIKRDVRILVGTLSVVPDIVEATDLIASVSRQAAERFAAGRRLKLHPLPFALPPIPLLQVWHERFDRDPGHQWLRRVVKSVCRDTLAADFAC